MDQKHKETASDDSSCDKEAVGGSKTDTSTQNVISIASQQINNEESCSNNDENCGKERRHSSIESNVESSESRSDNVTLSVGKNVEQQNLLKHRPNDVISEIADEQIEKNTCTVSESTSEKESTHITAITLVEDTAVTRIENSNTSVDKILELDENKCHLLNRKNDDTLDSANKEKSRNVISFTLADNAVLINMEDSNVNAGREMELDENDEPHLPTNTDDDITVELSGGKSTDAIASKSIIDNTVTNVHDTNVSVQKKLRSGKNDKSHSLNEEDNNTASNTSAENITDITILTNIDSSNANAHKEMELDENRKSNSSNEKDDDTNVIIKTISVEEISEIGTECSQVPENDRPDTSCMEIDSDLQDKEESIEKNIDEVEKTEFIQIVQDKTDDSQIEGQSIDAEDPFGGDSLAVESLVSNELGESDINFRKLGDQVDNLQDVLKAQKSTFQSSLHESDEVNESRNHDNEIEFISEISKEAADDISNDSVENRTIDDNQINTNRIPVESASELPKNDEKDGDDIKDKKTVGDENTSTETSEEQSTVLPGQDDELCIIPDSLKIILPQRSTKKISTEDIGVGTNSQSGSEKFTMKTNEEVCTEKSVLCDSNITQDVGKKEDDNIADMPVKQASSKKTDDVIDLDDGSKNLEIEEITTPDTCAECNKKIICKIKVKVGAESFNVCSTNCQAAFSSAKNRATDIPSDGANSKYEKRCASCLLIIEKGDERNLSWETMEFCNEECLGKFQTKYGSYCRNCNGSVAPISLGKYCVRFGYDVRQFCCSSCLEEFKKGLKVCSYCQKDISSGTDGFLAPVGDKGQFKDFCTQFCMEKYSKMNSIEPPSAEKKACSVCQEEKIIYCEVQVDRAAPVAICSEPCFAAFKFVNKVDPDQCSTCKKYFDQISKKSTVVVHNNEAHTFCNKTCLNIFIITHRKIVPCNWCKVKKYNFDMIKKELKTGQAIMMCSLNCLTLYQVSVNAVSSRRINCNFCKDYSQAQYHLTMSDATIRNFCCYDCVMKFQSQYTKSPITIPAGDDSIPVPTGTPKRTYPGKLQTQATTKKIVDAQSLPTISSLQNKKTMPVISSVTSLASNGPTATMTPKSTSTVTAGMNNATITNSTTSSATSQIIYKQQVITRPPSPVKIHNKMTQCKPLMHTKGVSVKPHGCTKSTQTDGVQKAIIPIPVPIYVPFPIHMFSFPFPVPMPFPLPIPVPIFIPTTRNTTKGILKEIKRIQEKMPADPFEAELLMMAEMVATDKKTTESDTDSSEENNTETVAIESGNAFGDDMFQMALKMAAGEIEEPAVDLEVALTPNTITASQASAQPEAASESGDIHPELVAPTRGKKRVVSHKSRGGPTKRGRRTSGTSDVPLMPPPESQQPSAQPRIIEPIEKPDANMTLKYTFGVNAWRKWVVAKNNELEKQNTSTRKIKLFKADLLQLTADELNYSLCLFVKEVRKPNGAEYAPDTIYYLCLGIQQYLFENNRIDNIFTDTYYEQFTDCLNDVAKKFSVLYNDAQYIVTRVEEEHLWECKQLGAHSPHVLLSTLMFFNTKHFNLVTVDEHMQLSFSHIMKHWKRNPSAQAGAVVGKAPGSRNVLLRFYPPQSALDANSKKKKVYEQQENEDNPLRCPVKLYEFYLSKCPESVKTRNDVFYLLPERSCVPDSPVWYSTSPLAKENLVKMLHRVKMVKEINIALLST